MHFLTSTLALTAFVAALASATGQDPTNDFFHNCSDPGCEFQSLSTTPRAIGACSCNTQPPSTSYLVNLFTGTGFQGYVYKGFGSLSSPYPTPTTSNCYKVPGFFYANSGSMVVNSAAGIVCQIFTNDDCTGYAWEVRTDIQQFYGYFENGLRSFQCFQNS